MNDEFATLKDMIPACKDQEMHKLAILSVSVFPSFTHWPITLQHLENAGMPFPEHIEGKKNMKRRERGHV